MTYDKTRDVLTILDQAVVHVARRRRAATAPPTSPPARATFARRDKYVRFERGVQMQRERPDRSRPTTAVAHLSADEKRVETLELRGNARITDDEGGRRRRCRR